MRLSLIGPGDIEYHYQKILGIPKDKFEGELEQIAKAIAGTDTEIELLPDKGICLELTKQYKKFNGKKVIGAVPKGDKTFGVSHLQDYIVTQINRKPLFDETIDTGDWFKHDMIKGLLGNAVLYLGSSPGTAGELNYAIYLYKLMTGNKKGVDVAGKYIHPEIRANKDFTIFVYSPFIIGGTLGIETEKYISKFGIKLTYIKDPKHLKSALENF